MTNRLDEADRDARVIGITGQPYGSLRALAVFCLVKALRSSPAARAAAASCPGVSSPPCEATGRPSARPAEAPAADRAVHPGLLRLGRCLIIGCMPWHGPDGHLLYYEDNGRGDAVVVMPGWAGSITDLSQLRAALLPGFRVIAVDLPGSGRSQPQPRSYEAGYYHDDARVVLGLLDALGVPVAHLAGFSDGGEVAVLVAGLRPGLALSLFTWGAAGKIEATPDELTALENAVDQPTDALAPLAAYLATAYGAGSARIMIRSWARAMRDLAAAGGGISRDRAHLITCPALLVSGTHDPHCPPGLTSELAALIPKGRFLEAPGAGHAVHLSHAAWLAGQLTNWLASH